MLLLKITNIKLLYALAFVTIVSCKHTNLYL